MVSANSTKDAAREAKRQQLIDQGIVLADAWGRVTDKSNLLGDLIVAPQWNGWTYLLEVGYPTRDCLRMEIFKHSGPDESLKGRRLLKYLAANLTNWMPDVRELESDITKRFALHMSTHLRMKILENAIAVNERETARFGEELKKSLGTGVSESDPRRRELSFLRARAKWLKEWRDWEEERPRNTEPRIRQYSAADNVAELITPGELQYMYSHIETFLIYIHLPRKCKVTKAALLGAWYAHMLYVAGLTVREMIEIRKARPKSRVRNSRSRYVSWSRIAGKRRDDGEKPSDMDVATINLDRNDLSGILGI